MLYLIIVIIFSITFFFLNMYCIGKFLDYLGPYLFNLTCKYLVSNYRFTVRNFTQSILAKSKHSGHGDVWLRLESILCQYVGIFRSFTYFKKSDQLRGGVARKYCYLSLKEDIGRNFELSFTKNSI